MSYIQNELAYENAIKRNIIANAQKTFFASVPDAQAIVSFCEDSKNEFCKKMTESFQRFGKLTEGQCTAVRKIMEKREQLKKQSADNSVFVGNVGEKITIAITVKKVIPVYTDFGISYIYICSSECGATLIYKGNAKFLPEGESGTINATIKAHQEREGVKQTIIQRPKIV